ncbi:hypothetical protein C2E23DRAFT_265563 [Lenzites betulinus]|nr:hypothetical protein C2E23DRAFT_265563 [Lenzites betulinus]
MRMRRGTGRAHARADQGWTATTGPRATAAAPAPSPAPLRAAARPIQHVRVPSPRPPSRSAPAPDVSPAPAVAVDGGVGCAHKIAYRAPPRHPRAESLCARTPVHGAYTPTPSRARSEAEKNASICAISWAQGGICSKTPCPRSTSRPLRALSRRHSLVYDRRTPTQLQPNPRGYVFRQILVFSCTSGENRTARAGIAAPLRATSSTVSCARTACALRIPERSRAGKFRAYFVHFAGVCRHHRSPLPSPLSPQRATSQARSPILYECPHRLPARPE